MRCPNPTVDGFPCRACDACKINDRRLWTNRILLEHALHSSSVFVTLTYDDDHIPETDSAIGTLAPGDLRNFWKKLRKAISPRKIRYYAVGEYGDETFRPHYHAIIFNYPLCEWGGTRHFKDPGRVCCVPCSLVSSAWGRGQCELGDVTPESAQYVAGYTLKKMTKDDDPRLQRGNSFLHPEFSRKSLKPGLGAGMIPYLAAIPFSLDPVTDDVPASVTHGKKTLPLGRYLRQRWRTHLGREKQTPQNAQLKIDEETMFPLRIRAKQNGTTVKEEIAIEAGNLLENLRKRLEVAKSRQNQQRKRL